MNPRQCVHFVQGSASDHRKTVFGIFYTQISDFISRAHTADKCYIIHLEYLNRYMHFCLQVIHRFCEIHLPCYHLKVRFTTRPEISNESRSGKPKWTLSVSSAENDLVLITLAQYFNKNICFFYTMIVFLLLINICQ